MTIRKMVDPAPYTGDAAIKRSNYGISGDIGGVGKQTYFTPDGRRLRAVPSIRDYIIRNGEGKVIESGERDGNYDKGWLPAMPKDLVPYCAGCDNWHDTQEEVDKCISTKEAKRKKWENWAKKEQVKEAVVQDKMVEDMRNEMTELKELVFGLTKQLKKNKPTGKVKK